MNFNIFGNKIAVTQVEEELSGSIELPQTRHKEFQLGRVYEVGNGKLTGKPDATMFFKKGEIVMFQTNPAMSYNCRQKLGDMDFFILHQDDLIAKMSSTKIDVESFSIAGNWVLLESFENKRSSPILLPENISKDSRSLRYRVVQIGAGVSEIPVGSEVLPEKSRCQVIAIDGKSFFFIHKSSILGIVSV